MTSGAATSPHRQGRRWALRTGRPVDAEAVLALWRAAEAEPTATDDPAGLARLLTHDPDALVVAEADGRIVGSLIVGFDGWRANLYRLAVHPDFRRLGLGRALVGEAEGRLAERGARRANALVVTEHAHAVGFWATAGYPRDPRISRHVKNLGDDVDVCGC